MKVTAVLLAAGQGTRMKSDLPKVLHPVCGRPMALYGLDAACSASTETPVLVVGVGADEVRKALGEGVEYVLQEKPLGTGHAVMQAERALKGKTDYVIVTYADMPLLRAETLQKLVETQKANPGPMSMLTVIYDDPRGFGRVVRKTDGTVAEIVEEYVATPEQLAIKELNVGAYCFRADWLWDALQRIPMSKKGEYYLTDTVELARKDHLPVQAIVLDDLVETIGVNTRIHLAEAEAAMRRRINEMHMLNGVTLIDPASTFIEAGVSISADTVVWPNTYLQGNTSIGQACAIGPNTHIRDSRVGDRC
jgi:bifunctional UDP-N-acetylglucosamine pyrophosphorylase/glucosamine-1-phosphate N-acetyltransferase